MSKSLSKEQLDAVARAAVTAAMEFIEKEKQKQQKVKRDKRLRNTKLLLKHYRDFVAHSETLQNKLTAIEEASMLNELHDEEFAVEAIKRSEQRTLVMVRFIQRALDSYQAMCEMSRQPEDSRRYKIVHSLYISEQLTTIEKLAERHNIDVSTIYKDVNAACKTLSVLIFGVDGIRFD
ncbi:HTH domain-containing protein [Paenibacillus flagellatus]|uniref:Helix-turn-helix type 11 domain-containing protein n=1 Tax=Paenibacillus flagellatus TaxID=2211139 RepID=A0A2V5KBU6_9BACL|nr:HTH domain-containing protein [Paenibacillus flagellatus]PYI57035.1 hypothetical protein DLM86_00880 [Paenibacillus flagellatus]